MSRPRKKEYSLSEKLFLLKNAGLNTDLPDEMNTQSAQAGSEDAPSLMPLKERIKQLLNIIQTEPMKATETIALIMYDIEDNKVRTLIAKYLIEKGCFRIQKSVYMVRAEARLFREITATLKEVQECYDNSDSILLVPIPANTPGSMQIIGKDIQVDTLVKNPNVLFF